MARLFPFRSEPSTGEGQPRVVDLEGEDADAVFGALSSTTARRIYARLDDEPGTPSDVADAIDSSIQNVRYHLENLENAGLIEVVDTWYSSRGNEMSVYATTAGPLIVTSDESTASQLRTALSRLLGGVGALAGGSLLVQYGLTGWLGPSGGGIDWSALRGTEDGGREDAGDDHGGANGGGTDGTDESPERAEAADEAADADRPEHAVEDTEDADHAEESAPDEYDVSDGGEPSGNGQEGADYAADGGAEAAEAVLGSVPPGLLFFLGGLVVLLAVTIYWYWFRPAY